MNSFFQLLILLSGGISLNPGPNYQHKLQCLNEWYIFKSRGLHFIHLSINSLLLKIEELRVVAKSTNSAIIGISESKEPESKKYYFESKLNALINQKSYGKP